MVDAKTLCDADGCSFVGTWVCELQEVSMKSSPIPLALCLSFLTSSALADSIFVEGHIRDLRTGMPIRAATVSLTDLRFATTDSSSSPEIVGKSVFTDDSGFFSIELREEELDREWVDISATCVTRSGVHQTDRFTHRVVLRLGTIRRDLYIDAFGSRRDRTCQLLFGFAD